MSGGQKTSTTTGYLLAISIGSLLLGGLLGLIGVCIALFLSVIASLGMKHQKATAVALCLLSSILGWVAWLAIFFFSA